MKDSTKVALLILLIFIIISGLIVVFIPISEFSSKYEIYIKNDNDFKKRKYSFAGTGTIDDPYRIENLEIETSRTYGIWIQDTTKYFIIRNCSITCQNTAIFLRSIKSNTAEIYNNTLTTYSHGGGVSIYWTSFINIYQNKIKDLDNPDDYFDSSGKGIILYDSQDCRVTYNYISNHRMGVDLVLKGNHVVENNFFEGCNFGLYSEATNNNSIRNNTMLNCGTGFRLISSNSTIIYYNSILNSWWGSDVSKSKGCIIYCNQFVNSSGYAIRIFESSDYLLENTIYYNNFLYNNLEDTHLDYTQVYDMQPLTKWYNETTLQGNYWSDIVWDEGIIYQIDGLSNTDPYPLENPVEI
ncbi:MAG: hypothetical protein GPJ52_00860 [Candidatus Heimdallarchaeota archaeon]|nr:hypothetical protein [Candidatus Heimdallarchaeota archaeon]